MNAPDAEPDALPDSAGGTGRYLRFSYPRFLRLQEALGNDGQLAGTTLFTIVGRLQGSPQASPMLTKLVTGLDFATLAPRYNAAVPSPTATCSATSALTWQ